MTSILGGCDILFKMLLLFIGIDYITGVLGAIYKGKLSSNVSAKGIIKKIGYILLVVVACLVGGYFIYDNLNQKNKDLSTKINELEKRQSLQYVITQKKILAKNHLPKHIKII